MSTHAERVAEWLNQTVGLKVFRPPVRRQTGAFVLMMRAGTSDHNQNLRGPATQEKVMWAVSFFYRPKGGTSAKKSEPAGPAEQVLSMGDLEAEATKLVTALSTPRNFRGIIEGVFEARVLDQKEVYHEQMELDGFMVMVEFTKEKGH